MCVPCETGKRGSIWAEAVAAIRAAVTMVGAAMEALFRGTIRVVGIRILLIREAGLFMILARRTAGDFREAEGIAMDGFRGKFRFSSVCC